MRFWTREAAGWLLIALGLFVFYKCYVLFDDHRLVEGSAMTVVGLIIFRGGIHLLKVAVAAEVCMAAQGRLEDNPSQARASRAPTRAPSTRGASRGV